MTDIPIIFSAPMVLALLREAAEPGTGKTMTRRLAWRHAVSVLERDRAQLERKGHRFARMRGSFGTQHWASPPSQWQNVKAGDRLWVRESLVNSQAGWCYAADKRLIEMAPRDPRVPAMVAWAHHKERDTAPSIHMPRWACRLTLIVTATKTEPLQDITMEDMILEGLTFRPLGKAEHTMAGALRVCDELTPKWEALWRKLHGDESWEENPDVVAITFRVVASNIDSLPLAA